MADFICLNIGGMLGQLFINYFIVLGYAVSCITQLQMYISRTAVAYEALGVIF